MSRAFGLLLMVAALAGGPAAAHEWYSSTCCDGRDCAPVERAAIERRGDAFLVVATGEAIGRGDARIERSLDGRFHRCVFPDGRTRCLYVPEEAM
jgi:hypothetical protein